MSRPVHGAWASPPSRSAAWRSPQPCCSACAAAAKAPDVRHRRALISLAVVALLLARSSDLGAHAALRASMPLDGATLGDGPTTIQLWFSERPEVALSEIRVADVSGATYQIERAEATPGDPLLL